MCTMFVQTKDLAQEHNVYEKELFRNLIANIVVTLITFWLRLTFSSQEETPLCLLSFFSSFSFKFEKGCGLKILADPKEKIRFWLPHTVWNTAESFKTPRTSTMISLRKRAELVKEKQLSFFHLSKTNSGLLAKKVSNDLYYLTRLERSEHSVGADVVIITEMQALYRTRVTFSTQPPVPYIKLFCDLCCLLERESSWKKTCSFLEIYLLVYSLIRKLTRLWFCLYHFRQLQCLGLSINMILEKLESLK